jgi:hypothetical protein
MKLVILSKDIEAEIRKECYKIGLDVALNRDLVTHINSPFDKITNTFSLTDSIVLNLLPDLEKFENNPLWESCKLQWLVCDCKITEHPHKWTIGKLTAILSKWLNGFTRPNDSVIGGSGCFSFEFDFTSENRLRLAMPLPDPKYDVDIEETKMARAQFGDIEL